MVDVKVDPTISEVPPVAPAAAPGFANRAKAGWQDSSTRQAASESKDTLKEVGKGLKAMLNGLKEMFVGGSGKAKGAVGGIVGGTVGAADSVTGKAIKIVNSIASSAAGFAQKYQKTAAVAVVVTAALAVRGFFKKRDQKAELAELTKRGELAATQLSNSAMQSSMPEFNNEATRADFVKKYGTRDQSQSNARA